jgi:hypothetical protein
LKHCTLCHGKIEDADMMQGMPKMHEAGKVIEKKKRM